MKIRKRSCILAMFLALLIITIVWISIYRLMAKNFWLGSSIIYNHRSCTNVPSTLSSAKEPQNFIPSNPDITKDNWKGQCPYPWYIPPAMQNQSWFQRFLHHLQRVDLSKAESGNTKKRDCSRWWSTTPQHVYDINLKPKPKPSSKYHRPQCTNFGRQLVPRTHCSSRHEILWKTLDQLGILYFPRAGTELGIVRGSSYLTTDGDLDIYVDMSQKQLLEVLKKVLTPHPNIVEFDYTSTYTEIHWHVWGCPEVHLVFNDQMDEEMGTRSGHTDTCECFLNSVPLSCDKNAIYRMFLMYGPTWRVPLHAKALDVPHVARHYNIVGVLRRLASKDGVIREDAVRNLDLCVVYTDPEMQMILAQLNDLHAMIGCEDSGRCSSLDIQGH